MKKEHIWCFFVEYKLQSVCDLDLSHFSKRSAETGGHRVQMNRKKFKITEEIRKELESQPLSKLSVSTVCDNLKCSRQSFYYYFKDIEDCYTFYLQESFKTAINADTILKDAFNYFGENMAFVKACVGDFESGPVFWDTLLRHLCARLDETFEKSVPGYNSLSAEEKDVTTSFYGSGIARQLALYVKEGDSFPKEKYIEYCRCLIGSVSDIGNAVSRFSDLA